MRSRTATWFECKVRYDQTQENGSQKAVTEQYVVDALSFAEAEKRITEEMASYISGEFEVTDVKKAAYKEVFFTGHPADTKYYEVKLLFSKFRKGDDVEHKIVPYLMQGFNIISAAQNIDFMLDDIDLYCDNCFYEDVLPISLEHRFVKVIAPEASYLEKQSAETFAIDDLT